MIKDLGKFLEALAHARQTKTGRGQDLSVSTVFNHVLQEGTTREE